MKCPLLWRGFEVEVPAGARHGFLPGVRRGAGHENTGSDFASAGEKDYLVAGGRDHRHQRPADASLVPALPRIWLRRAVRPPPRATEPQTRGRGDGRADARTVSRPLLRSKRAALLREVARG